MENNKIKLFIPKPGQIYTINGIVCRVKKRSSLCLCKDCTFDCITECPNVNDTRTKDNKLIKKYDCFTYSIIFKRI